MPDLLRDGNPQYLATELLEKHRPMTFQFQEAANVMASKIKQYRRHRWFGYTHMGQRIGSLKEIKFGLLRIGREPCVNKAKWAELKSTVDAEFYFLDKLQRHQKQRNPQFNELIDALENSQGGATAKRVTTTAGGKVHSSLRGAYIMETLDPLHRGRSPDIALALYQEFKKWRAGDEGQLSRGVAGAAPWDQLMAFFLYWHDKDPSRTKLKPTYHGDKQRFLDSLEFDGMTLSVRSDGGRSPTRKRVGKALSYYAFSTNEDRQTTFERYDLRKHGGTLIPYQAPFHTVSKQRRGSHATGQEWAGTVVYPENTQKARGFSETDAQLCWASLYVLVNGVFYTAHADDFHSWASGGASVAAAGLIAADNGKIVAIDNASGHYAPNWRQLRQAVQLIANNGAFSDHGVVGLGYKYDHATAGEALNAAILPWMDFLKLCHVIRNRDSRMQLWNSMTRRYPPLPTMANQCSGTLAVHTRIWDKNKFTWEKVGSDLFAYLDTL
jgi:hypothetical protein